MPYNPNQPLKRATTLLRAISINTSGIVAVTCRQRRIHRARANYNGGGASGQALTNVVGASGSVVDVQFLGSNGAESGTPISLETLGSGTGFSGGCLTVWSEGV